MKEQNGNVAPFSRRDFIKVSTVGGAALLAGCQGVQIDPGAIAAPIHNQTTQATSLPEITTRTLETNGINMQIHEAGEGFPVIFLHGFIDLGYSWHHQLPAVAAAGYHAIALDQRGFGGTDAPPDVESYSMRYLAADIIGLLDELGREQCVLVAHDWGTGSLGPAPRSIRSVSPRCSS